MKHAAGAIYLVSLIHRPRCCVAPCRKVSSFLAVRLAGGLGFGGSRRMIPIGIFTPRASASSYDLRRPLGHDGPAMGRELTRSSISKQRHGLARPRLPCAGRRTSRRRASLLVTKRLCPRSEALSAWTSGRLARVEYVFGCKIRAAEANLPSGRATPRAGIAEKGNRWFRRPQPTLDSSAQPTREYWFKEGH